MTWVNSYYPPTFTDPLVIRKVADLPTWTSSAYNMVGAGETYRVRALEDGGAADRDIYINLAGEAPLDYPLLIETKGSVILRGIYSKPVIQAGNDVGDLPNLEYSEHPNSNDRPRWPVGCGIRLKVAKTAWIEGAYMDCQGHNTDAIVWAVTSDDEIAEYNVDSKVYIVNSRFVDYEGSGSGTTGPIGDDLHADCFQSQRGSAREFYAENIVIKSGMAGLNCKPAYGATWDRQEFRNISYEESVDYIIQPRGTGSFFATNIADENLIIHNCYKSNALSTTAVWGDHDGEQAPNWRYVAWNEPSGNVPLHYEITKETTPSNDFAPSASVGSNYVSPFIEPDAMLSNLLTDQFNTLAILHTPRTDTVTPTGAKLYITSNLDADTTYWAVFSESSAKTPAEIITPTGAADSGNAPAQLTEDEFTATALDTEANRYYVWYAHTDSTVAVSGVAFGASASMSRYYHYMRRKALA